MAYRLLGYGLGSLLLAAVAVAGCYTGPVNMRPTVEINRPATRIFRGQTTAPYTATASDPDGGPPTLGWTWTEGGCPTNFKSPDAWPASPKTWEPGTSFDVGAPITNKSFCVWVKATDKDGASDVDTWPEVPANHLPDVHIDLILPMVDPADDGGFFPLHTAFMFSGARTTDADQNDDRKFIWHLRNTKTPGLETGDCPGQADPALTCFTADVADDYVVELTFKDGTDEVVAMTKPILVRPGHPPVPDLVQLMPSGAPPFRLGSIFKLSAKGSTDPDRGDAAHLTYKWEHAFPLTASDNFGPCADDMSEYMRCFTADAKGTYGVSVTVSDGTNTSAPLPLKPPIEVSGDAMPCLGQTDPAQETPLPRKFDEDQTFTVTTVDDDLDPFPNLISVKDQAKVDWFLDDGSGKFALMSAGTPPSFTIPANTFRLGDEIRVRVQIRDRDNTRSQKAFDTCTTDKCGGDGCLQRWTWTVPFNQ